MGSGGFEMEFGFGGYGLWFMGYGLMVMNINGLVIAILHAIR